MSISSTGCAYLTINNGVSTEQAKEVIKWLQSNNILACISLEENDLYMREDFADFNHLFFVYESNDLNKVSKRVAKHVKYANSIGMPCYMIYKRHSDGTFQIYTCELYKDNRISFGGNVTSKVIYNYLEASKTYHEAIKLDTALEKYLFIEQLMPSGDLSNDAYKRKIDSIHLKIKHAKEKRDKLSEAYGWKRDVYTKKLASALAVQEEASRLAKHYNAEIMFEKEAKLKYSTKRTRFQSRNYKSSPVIMGSHTHGVDYVKQIREIDDRIDFIDPIEENRVIINKKRKYHLLRKK